MLSQKCSTKFNAYTPWNPPVTLNCMHKSTHTHSHYTYCTCTTPEDCNNVPDYCIAANLEPTNSNFPLKDVSPCLILVVWIVKRSLNKHIICESLSVACYSETTEQPFSDGLNMRSMTERYIHETGKSTSKVVQSDLCLKNKT